MKAIKRSILIILLVPLLLVSRGDGRQTDHPMPGSDRDSHSQRLAVNPAHGIVAHRIGKIHLGICNNGTFGNNYSQAGTADFFTGDVVLSCEYPKGSNNRYLFGGTFWDETSLYSFLSQ